jgi:hypothetical protein
MMNAEDKVLLLAECVPMHVGTADEKAALSELTTVLPQVCVCVCVCVCVRSYKFHKSILFTNTHTNTHTHKQQVIEDVKSKLPEATKTDAQLLAVDLCVTDFLHEPAESRASFVDWVKELNSVDMQEFLKVRLTYKEVAVPSAEI